MSREPRDYESQAALRSRLAALLAFAPPAVQPTVEVVEQRMHPDYVEQLVRYPSPHGDDIAGWLLRPAGSGPFPAVVANHQHNSEWHLGKSEVAGLAGDPSQAFGPALAQSGVAVLAPDTVCFEDRRRTGPGTEPRQGDWLQHYNETAYRLVEGELLMSTILADAAQALSALAALDVVDESRIGVIGHSLGGNTTLFYAALDQRVRFACASGAACTYRRKMASGTGIELAEVITGIRQVADIDDIVGLVAPRPLLLVSATDDRYSEDADDIEQTARQAYVSLGAGNALKHVRFTGGHGLTDERLKLVTRWVVEQGQHPG